MKLIKRLAVVGMTVALAGCEGGLDNKSDKTIDRGFDTKSVSQLIAGIWVDPNGCQHWIIDDGVEGYLSARMDQYGKPICNGIYPKGYAVGNYKQGSSFSDII